MWGDLSEHLCVGFCLNYMFPPGVDTLPCLGTWEIPPLSHTPTNSPPLAISLFGRVINRFCPRIPDAFMWNQSDITVSYICRRQLLFAVAPFSNINTPIIPKFQVASAANSLGRGVTSFTDPGA